MPDPVEYLRKAYRGATSSIVPESWSNAAADAIDSPSLERSPWEARMRGFGAGAVQGLRDQLSPLNIGMSLVPGYRAVRGAGAAADAARAARNVTGGSKAVMQIVDDVPEVQQVMPGMDDVDALVGDLTRNLARIRPKPPAAPTPMRPELVPVGEEAAYNTARQAGSSLPSYGDGFYREMMKKLGGRQMAQ